MYDRMVCALLLLEVAQVDVVNYDADALYLQNARNAQYSSRVITGHDACEVC